MRAPRVCASRRCILYLDNMRDRGVTGTTDWVRYEVQATIPDGTEWVYYGALLAGSGTAWFDSFHVEDLDAAELPDPSEEARAYLQRALNIIERFALRRDEVDWSRIQDEALAQARGAADAAAVHTVLRNTLRTLGDRHSVLLAPPEARAWEAGADPAGRPEPMGVMLSRRVAYLEVPRFSGDVAEQVTAYADALQNLIRTQAEAGACGWVVDLRGNSGGNMWPMLAGLGPLFGDGELGGFRGADGEQAAWWYRGGATGVAERTAARVSNEPFILPTLPPVAVLVGPTTASSGEAVALALTGRDNAASFGAPTAGLTTGNQLFVLSDGALLWLTTSVFVDRDGRAYGGPVQPDHEVIPTAASQRGADPVRDSALTWLKRSCL
ncbi:MAG: S41 family peptidase [Xanthomonadaceae bacterium]|nr:S41 family peptidase [Xanthomonadaceae bacterium]